MHSALRKVKSIRHSFMGGNTNAPSKPSKQSRSSRKSTPKTSRKNSFADQNAEDMELTALKQVCLSYIDIIESVIDSIPEKKDDEEEPDFESVFLQLKTFVTSAKRQLGRQEIDNKNKEERTLKLKPSEIAALPDLPSEEPFTPSTVASGDSVFSNFPDHQSTGSLFSGSDVQSHHSHHTNQSTKSWMGRKFTSKSGGLGEELNKKRIRTEIKVLEKQLKLRKFELLPNNIWTDYLLKYLCRNEQFVLSSTCTYVHTKCGIDSFVFSQQFEFDNVYWRENFFNFIDPTQDSTIYFVQNQFEELTSTQRRQLKYFIKFWEEFIVQRQERKKQRQLSLNNDSEQKSDENEENIPLKNEVSKSKSKSKPHKLSKSKSKENILDNHHHEDDEEMDENKEADNDENENEEPEQEQDENENDADDNDLYARDNFEYDDDRPRGLVLLEKYRSDFESSSEMAKDAALHVAIPLDAEQLIIRDCKNKKGELAHWLSSLLCYVPTTCPIDWLGLENNSFQDRDIHRICAGLLNRQSQSNLVGLSLSNNANITDKCIAVLLKTISKKCHKLQFLKLSGCTKLTNKSCQYILDFYTKTYDDDSVQLCYIDLGNNYKINDKGIVMLNQIYLKQESSPTNVVVRFNVAGTQWKDAMDDWNKNIILRPPKR